MERIAILNHLTHELYVEDITDEMLAKYNGEEEQYIEDNYNVENGEYSWDYIVDAVYFENEDSDPITIDFNSLTE